MKSFCIKCSTHFPGYETDGAQDILTFWKRASKWSACRLDRKTLHELDLKDIKENLLLDAWEREWWKEHPKDEKSY